MYINSKSAILLISIALSFSHNSFGQALNWLSQPKSNIGHVLNAQTLDTQISANGRFIALRTSAKNVIQDDRIISFGQDLYVYDRLVGTVRWVNEPTNLSFPFQTFRYSAPTSDGSLIAFITRADFGFGNDDHLYTKNLMTGEIRLISRNANGDPYEVTGAAPYLLDDGSAVIIATREQLVPEHTNSAFNTYRIDLLSGEATLLSVSDDDTEASSSNASDFNVSASGRYVVFRSSAVNLVEDAVVGENYYLRDTLLKTTQLVTVQASGAPSASSENVSSASVSNTGVVTYLSRKDDLVANDNNQKNDLFLFDGNSNTRINLGENNTELSDTRPNRPMINATGNIITFNDIYAYSATDQDDLVDDAYQYDIPSGQFTHIDLDIGDNSAIVRDISASGQSIVIQSAADVASARASISAVLFGGWFLYDTNSHSAQQIEPVAFAPNTVLSSVNRLHMSSDQRYAVFDSGSPNLIQPAEIDATRDVFLHDRIEDTHERIGHLAFSMGISPNGRYVVISSSYLQPEAQVALGAFNLFLYDRHNNSYVQIAPGTQPEVNDQGLVVFQSDVALLPSDNNNVNDIYLFDPSDNSISLISQVNNGPIGNALSERAFINNDPNDVSIVFVSDADNLIPGDINQRRDVFVADWPDGNIVRVSQTPAFVGGDGFSYLADISADGQTVAFASFSSNLTNDVSAGLANIFVYDRLTQNITLVSRDDTGAPLDNDFFALSLSDGGHFISFFAQRPLEFLGEDPNSNDFDAFLIDLSNDQISLISQSLDGSEPFISVSGVPKVYEDLSVSPPRVGVSFVGSAQLTGVSNHPGYDEAFLYQQGGPNVNLNIDVVGTGTVSGTLGISCMTNCDSNYPLGTNLSLVASPDSGFVFDRWITRGDQCGSDNVCDITMNIDQQVRAVFIDPNEIIFTDAFE